MLTLSEAKRKLARVAAGGVKPNDSRVVDRINEAAERLFDLTDFKGKKVRYKFCTSQACITLPRHLETVFGANVDKVPYGLRNQWFEHLPAGPGELDTHAYSIKALVDRGDDFPTFRDLCGAHYLRVYCDVAEENGAKVLVQGVDQYGNEIMSLVGGEWVFGEYIALNNAAPQASTKKFTKITRIIKPRTNGFVRIYQYRPAATESSALSNYNSTLAANPAPNNTLPEDVGLMTISWNASFTDSTVAYVSVYGTSGAGLATFYDENFVSLGAYSILSGENTFVIDGKFTVTINGVPTSMLNVGVITNFKITRTVLNGPVGTPASQSLIALIHPDEEVPVLRRYLIPGIPTDADDRHTVTVLAQRRFVPVYRDEDVLFPSNIGALKNMMIAIEKEERNDLNAAEAHTNMAVRLLKEEMKQFLGPTRVQPLNMAMFGTQPHNQLL